MIRASDMLRTRPHPSGLHGSPPFDPPRAAGAEKSGGRAPSVRDALARCILRPRPQEIEWIQSGEALPHSPALHNDDTDNTDNTDPGRRGVPSWTTPPPLLIPDEDGGTHEVEIRTQVGRGHMQGSRCVLEIPARRARVGLTVPAP